ncbi:MAG: 3-dehydroquinate synthase [Desulfuromonas sp.]|nr:MAG: 3-dehydroquinate synthase [Desulfuromonas sp.]
MSKTNIILTGFMGTGKTTVGKNLAKKLNYAFVDTDHLIEERIGMSIAEYFKQEGEDAFRQQEALLARELADREGHVISTGGRFMLDPGNAATLSKTGRVFCLVATPDEILQRVSQDDHVRPLLQVANPLENIVELLQQRKEGYGQFPQFVTSAKDPEAVASDLASFNTGDQDMRLAISSPGTLYEFIVGGGLLPFVSQLAGIDGQIAVITDSTVAPLYAQSCGAVDIKIIIPPGRQHKTLATAQSIFEQLLEKGFDRSGTIIALGGTVISELAGFVAATYMRGVDCVQCPTSLLAMADTSIGGKTGIDVAQSKNLIGAFRQPKAVIADVATLASLTPKAFSSGMAEIIKHSLLADSDLLERIESGGWKSADGFQQPALAEMQSLVARSIQVKINIIQEDPFDEGRRIFLNLGHTFANAIEQQSGYTISHGEAVAMGLVAAAHLSYRLDFCPGKVLERVESVLQSVNLPTRIPVELEPTALISAMSSDKKKKAGKLRYVLLKNIGEVFVTDQVPEAAVLETLHQLRG